MLRRVSVVLIAVFLLGASDPPIQSGGEQTQKIQTESRNYYKNPASDQPGTTANPIVVDVKPAPDHETRMAENRRDTDEKASIDWKIMVFTGAIAAFTILLVIVTAVQVGLFFWQLRLIRRGADDANIAALAAKESANTAKRAFENLERPYLFIFGVTTIQILKVGIAPRVVYSVANYGKTPAIIENFSVGFQVCDGLPDQFSQRADTEHVMFTSPIVASNEIRTTISEEIPLGIDIIRVTDVINIPAIQPNEELYFSVVAIYRGPFTSGHRSLVFWRYDRASAHFVPYNQEGYNHTQ